jgi:hypothetical protein
VQSAGNTTPQTTVSPAPAALFAGLASASVTGSSVDDDDDDGAPAAACRAAFAACFALRSSAARSAFALLSAVRTASRCISSGREAKIEASNPGGQSGASDDDAAAASVTAALSVDDCGAAAATDAAGGAADVREGDAGDRTAAAAAARACGGVVGAAGAAAWVARLCFLTAAESLVAAAALWRTVVTFGAALKVLCDVEDGDDLRTKQGVVYEPCVRRRQAMLLAVKVSTCVPSSACTHCFASRDANMAPSMPCGGVRVEGRKEWCSL